MDAWAGAGRPFVGTRYLWGVGGGMGGGSRGAHERPPRPVPQWAGNEALSIRAGWADASHRRVIAAYGGAGRTAGRFAAGAECEAAPPV